MHSATPTRWHATLFKADKVVDYTVRPAYFEKLIRSAGGEAASSLLNSLSDGLRWR